MKQSNAFLFITPSILWGTTWYAITFQLGTVNPLVSVGYRFALAGFFMLLLCLVLRRKLAFDMRTHLLFATLGATLFGLNYWLIYEAEEQLASGLVALLFSSIIFFNIFLNRLMLKAPVKWNTVIGGIAGFAGTFLIFRSEILNFSFLGGAAMAFVFCFASVMLASFGNILSARLQRNRIPVLPATAYAMLYGALLNFAIAFVLGREFSFESTFSYAASLIYLSLFGSVITFAAYLKLIGAIGPDRAVYVALVTPVVALVVSTIFEGFQWNAFAALGSALILAGNYIALKTRRTAPSTGV